MKNTSEIVYALSNDIIRCSYFAIEYFHWKGKDISSIKLQKFMYLVEAFYIAVFNKPLFDTQWYARQRGPVSEELYEYYQNFKFSNIVLKDNERKQAREIPEANKMLIRAIYKKFGELETYGYIAITHKDGSPWSDLMDEHGIDFLDNKGEYVVIDKDNIGEWYRNEYLDLNLD